MAPNRWAQIVWGVVGDDGTGGNGEFNKGNASEEPFLGCGYMFSDLLFSPPSVTER